jgi:ACS family tartrate transporter-like MFS transporter
MPEAADRIGARVLRKLAWRILPFVVLLYFVSFLDRVNVGIASLTMNRDVGLSPAVYGLGAGIFFLGYFLFEVPSNLILHRIGARVWIARVMVTWGLVSVAMAWVQGPASFISLRFLLGVAEAGFFPGIILYLSTWFPARHRAAATAVFMAAAPLSTALGSPVSGALLQMHGLWGLKGWQWLFLLEGAPAILLGFVVLAFLTDRPKDARWLADDERAWLMAQMQREQVPAPQDLWQGLKLGLADRRVLALALVYFGASSGLYTLGLWAPQIIAEFGLSPLAIGLVNALPGIAAVIAMVWWSRHSDATGERTWHVAGACLLAAAGLAWAGVAVTLIGVVLALMVVNVGVSCAKPPLWAMPTRFLSGPAAAAGIAAINAIGNLGGFAGPVMIGWLKDLTGSLLGGLYFVAGLLLASALLVVLLARGNPALAKPHGQA